MSQAPPSVDIIPYPVFLHTLDSLIPINGANAYSRNIFKNYHQQWENDIPKNYDKLINLAIEKKGSNSLLVAYLIHKKGVYYYIEDAYEKALPAFIEALKIRQEVLGHVHVDVGKSLYTIGVTCKYLSRTETAMEYLNKGLEIQTAVKDTLSMVRSHEQLGATYNDINEYETAERYYEAAIKILEKKNDLQQARIARLYNFLGEVKINQQQFNLAYDFLNQAIKIYEQYADNGFYDPITYYQNLAIALEALGKVKEAEKVNFNKVLPLVQMEYGKKSKEVVEIYENIGVDYKNQNEIKKAFEYLNKALGIQQQLVSNKKALQYNSLYHNLGATHQKTKNYTTALDYFQKAIQQQIVNFNEKDIYKNPDLSTANFLGTKPSLLKDVDFKAYTFYQWYQSSKDIQHLKAAFDTYIIASELIDLMRGEFTAKGSKLFWMEQTYPIFERAIEVALLLSEQTGETRYAEQVFTLMEKNKAILLLESLQESKGKAFTNIPDSLLEQQRFLVESIADKKREIIELTQDNASDSLLSILENEGFQLELALQEWEKNIQATYPSYHQLTKDIQVLALKDVQNEFLKPHQVMLEFFMGDSIVYLAAITQENYQVLRLPKTAIETHIATLRTTLLTPQNTEMDYDENYEIYTKVAHELYQLLFSPIEVIMADKEELIIIPDGSLAAIPFDVLLQTPQGEKKLYRADYLNYLINDFAINYAYSATLLAQQVQFEAQKTPHFFMGFAPLFEGEKVSLNYRSCADEPLSPLPSNELEITSIAALFGHQNFMAKDASKTNFLNQAAQCRILHLATHACVDEEYPDQSRIYFTDDYLYAHELYNLNLQADMVVLSACETGVGEYQKGEGVMNLARGFAYAGTPSITMSLWSVNDETTAQLMMYYYQHIDSGLATHQALRAAKLDFLQNQEDKAKLHPFYWAAFVQVGQTTPILENTKIGVYGFIFIVFLLLIVFVLYKKYKRT